jgi:cytochrome c oxidase subunit 2
MVVEPDTYTKWLEGTWVPDDRKTAPGNRNAIDGSLAHQGRQLFMKLNCIQCHNTENPRAPVLEEIYKTVRPLRGGTSVIADDEYIRESIVRPRAKIREGWEPIMPHFGPDKVSPEDVNKLVAYIKSLKKGDTPKRTDNWEAPVGAPTEPQPPAKSTDGGGPK